MTSEASLAGDDGSGAAGAAAVTRNLSMTSEAVATGGVTTAVHSAGGVHDEASLAPRSNDADLRRDSNAWKRDTAQKGRRFSAEGVTGARQKDPVAEKRNTSLKKNRVLTKEVNNLNIVKLCQIREIKSHLTTNKTI